MNDTEKRIEKLLRTIAVEERYDDPQIKLKRVDNQSIMCNLTTTLYRASISSPNRADLKLFTKAAVFSKELRENALKDFYKVEMTFYSQVARTFDWLQDKFNIKGYDRVVFPKCYGCNQKFMEELVVLEDLSQIGFKCWDTSESADWKYAAKAVGELAKFHALSMAYGEINPMESEKLLRDMKYFPPAELETFALYIQRTIDIALEATVEQHRDKLAKHMADYGQVDDDAKYYNPILKPVLRHGDYKNTNLLYRQCSDGQLQMSIIDFQTLHTGCGVADLITFIYTATDRQFRRRHYHQLIEWYYEELCGALARFGLKADDVYPRKDFDYELKEVRPFGIVAMLYYLPQLLTVPEERPVVSNKTQFGDFVVRPGPLYGERLNEAIEEFIELGIMA